MYDMNQESRNTRGSSPPFQELERWIEDGANGSHWVRVVSPASHHPMDPVKGFDQSGIEDASMLSSLNKR